MIRAVLAALAGLAPAAAAAAPDAPTVHHEVELRLDPAEHRLQARDRIELHAGGRLRLQLLDALQVESLQVDGEPAAIVRTDGALLVDLGAAARHSVRIVYAGRLPPDRGNGGLGPVVQPAGSFLPPGGGWLPRGAGERITYRVAASVPADQRVLVTGAETDAGGAAGGRRHAVFRADYPSAGPAVFAGPYAETRRDADGTLLRTLFPRTRADGGTGELAARYLDSIQRYLAHYAGRIGAYPYPAFSVVAAPFPVGLGFEGATYVSQRILDLPYMQGRSLAHEILHSWWGGAVAIDYAGGNWAEGLTTYQADHWVTAQRGAAAAAELRRQWLRDFAALPASRRRPLAAFAGKQHDADQVTGYNKAAMLFHMLRRRLGDAAFRAGLAGFYDRHRFARADWADLRAAFGAVSDAPLDGFFAQWLTRPGAPSLRLERAERRRTDAGWAVDLRLSQSAPAYDLRVPVAFETADGPVRREVALTGRSADATLTLDAAPAAATVDPDADLFRALPASQVPLTLRHLTLDPATRVAAAGVDEAVAERIAGGLLDVETRTLDAAAAIAGDAPLLLVGTAGAVADRLAQAGFAAPPEEVAGRGSVRAWTAERHGRRVLAVAGRDAEALRRAAPALGYRLRRSWLVLDGRRVVDEGVWPTGQDPLRVAFGPAQ